MNQRFRDEGASSYQFFTRSSVSYHINPKTNVGVGFDHLIYHPAGKEASDENQLWQQFAYKFDAIYGAIYLVVPV